MLERSTREARQIITVAQTLARETGRDEIRTEHLLLAVLSGDGVGRRVLEDAGGRIAPSHLTFSVSAEDGLFAAMDEVSRLGSRRITDGHVLLALLARDQAPAARLLHGIGVEPAGVRLHLETAMAASGPEP